MPEPPKNPLDVFRQAPLDGPLEDLAAYLDEACAGDASLRARVEAMIAADRDDGRAFMEPVTRASATRAGAGTIEAHAVSEQPGDTIGPYRLVRQIGEGGFGVVYLAEQLEPVKRQVALKVIKVGMDTREVVARFEAERQALAMMDHPNIAKIFDAGATSSGRPYFVMELVRGIPVTEFCDKENLSTAERLELFVQICHAVQHAHQKGIIHRDLKPSNVLVAAHDSPDAGPVPKVIDFGVAKATQGDLTDRTLFTRLEQFIGTPAYMSPEQARMSGVDIDTRSDIYSLGVLLYELLTGRTPFDARELIGAGFEEMRRVIRESEPPKPSTRLATLGPVELTEIAKHRRTDPQQLRLGIRGDLDWIIMKALEKDRGRRFETADALAMDIRRHLADEPVLAAAPSTAYRLRKYCARHRAALATGAVITLLLVAGTVASTILALRARESEARATEERRRAVFSAADSGRDIDLLPLIRLLRDDPGDRPAAQRLASALWQRNFPRPMIAPVREADRAWFHPDGTHFVTIDREGMQARVWTVDGRSVGEPIRCAEPAQIAGFRAGSEGGLELLTSGSTGANRRSVVETWRFDPGRTLWVAGPHSFEVDRWIDAALWSPDGTRVLIDGGPATTLWDPATGAGIELAGAFARSAAWSPDGSLVATGSRGDEANPERGGTVTVWNAGTGEPVAGLDAIAHSSASSVVAVEFSPDGGSLLTASEDGTARVWSIETGEPLTPVLRHEGPIESARFGADGTLVVTASQDATARLWDVATGEPLTEPLRHDVAVKAAAFDPFGGRVATGAVDGTVRVWDVVTGRRVGPILPHGRRIETVAFSPDGRLVLGAAADGGAKLWRTPRGIPRARGHWILEPDPETGIARVAVFSPDGTMLVTPFRRTRDGQYQFNVWDVRTGRLLRSLAHPTDGTAWAAFNADGTRLVTAGKKWGARVWNTSDWSHVQLGGETAANGAGENDFVYKAAFSPGDGRWVAGAVLLRKAALVWEAETGRVASTLEHDDWVSEVAFHPDGRRLATGCYDGTARIWDLSTDRCLAILTVHPGRGEIRSLCFSPDGTLLLTSGEDGAARIWPVAGIGIDGATEPVRTDEPAAELRHHEPVVHAEFSPGGRRIVTASDDGTARLWDAGTGRPLGEAMRHDRGVTTARFSADGDRIVTGSRDGSVRIWDARSGDPLSDPMRHEGPVYSVQFSPDGHRAASVGLDMVVRVWDVPPPARDGDPLPAWFLDWAEAVVGVKATADGGTGTMAWTEREAALQRGLTAAPGTPLGRLAAWVHDLPDPRTLSPFSDLEIDDYLSQCTYEGIPGSLEAILADPQHFRALDSVAKKRLRPRLSQPGTMDFRQGQHCARQALRLQPSQPRSD